MSRFFSNCRCLGLLAFTATCLGAVSSYAQPPGGEVLTVRGTVKSFTTAPKGEVDGVILTDGTVVHWPPHLADRFSNIVAKGDKVKVIGWMETGPKGDTKLEVSKLTNLATDETRVNDDRTALGADPKGKTKGKGKGKGPKGPDPDCGIPDRERHGQRFHHGTEGEVDGVMLTDGTWVHWPPHLADRFSIAIVKSDKVKVQGYMVTGPKGDTKLEVSTLTNLRTNKTTENPDRPAPASSRVIHGKTSDVEERIQALEEKLDQLQAKELALRKDK